MQRFLTHALCVVALAGWAASARAQSLEPVAYIQGGATVNRQAGPSGTVSETYVTAPGGVTAGWLVGGGVGIGRHASADVEWATTGTMTATEPSRYFMTYHEERRDRFLTLGARFHLHAGRSVTIEPLAGLSVIFPQGWSQASYTDPILPRPPQPRVTHVLKTAVGPAFGCDVRLGASRVTLVPGVRVVRSAISSGRYDDASTSPSVEISSIYPGGYPQWTLRASIALRASF